MASWSPIPPFTLPSIIGKRVDRIDGNAELFEYEQNRALLDTILR